jgi:hypothetical protein
MLGLAETGEFAHLRTAKTGMKGVQKHPRGEVVLLAPVGMREVTPSSPADNVARTAPHVLGSAETKKGIVEAASRYTPRSTPAIAPGLEAAFVY